MKKKIVLMSLLCVSLVANILGLLIMLKVSEIAPIPGLGFIDKIQTFVVRYVVLIAIMAVGIMGFAQYAARLENPLKKKLLIVNTVYSSVLTTPLLFAFILCLIHINGTNVAFVKPIAESFAKLFPSVIFQHILYVLLILVSIIFLAVPILTNLLTIKDKKIAISIVGMEKPLPKEIEEASANVLK